MWKYVLVYSILCIYAFVYGLTSSVIRLFQHYPLFYRFLSSIKLLMYVQCSEICSTDVISIPVLCSSCQSGSGIHLCKANYKLPITCTSLKWTEIHPLIDCCIFSNKAADWFTCALIAIYVGLWCSSCERFWESGFTELLQTPVKETKKKERKNTHFKSDPLTLIVHTN